MADKRPRIKRLATIVSDIRVEVTGSPLTVPDTSTWSVTDFGNLVSDLYMWLREGWGGEISYLLRNAVTDGTHAGIVRRFSSVLNDLRTSLQHSDTSAADRSKDQWLLDAIGRRKPEGPEDWSRACAALVQQCEHALEALVALAKAIEADELAGARWRQAVEAEAEVNLADTLAVILGDLGVSVDSSTKAFLVRTAESRWSYRRQVLTAADSVEEEIEHLVERLVVGHIIEPLPCSYADAIDVVDLEPGSSEIAGFLLLAHGAAALLDYETGDEFLSLISERFRGWFAAD